MLIRKVKPSDAEEMFANFRNASVTAQDIRGKNIPNSGFYEYHLTFADFKKRAESPFSLVCINNRRIVSYSISYSVSYANRLLESGQIDPVLSEIKDLEGSVVYHDQLLVQRGIPAYYFAARVLQTADRLAQNENAPGVIGATPESPWKNRASSAMLARSGFSKKGNVEWQGFQLGLYVKPFWPLDTPFEDFGEKLIIPD